MSTRTKDLRGVPTTADADCLDAYEHALTALQSYVGDPLAEIEPVLARHPDFVLGHVVRAIALFLTSERRHLDEMRKSVAAAEALANIADERERMLTAAARQLLDGDLDGARRTFDTVLVEHPRDILALQTAHILDFMRGDALNLRNRVSRILPHWYPTLPGYGYVLGMHAFGLEECNQYPEAETTGRRALDIQPKDGWAVHAVTHVMEMTGRVPEGIEWLETRIDDWAPENLFAYHNWWHLALFHLDRGDDDRVLELFDTALLPNIGDSSLGMVDAAALIWRLQLFGIDTGQRADALATSWADRIEAEAGHYAFNDFHMALTFAAAGRDDLMAETLRLADRTTTDGNDNTRMWNEAGRPLTEGIRAFAAGDYQSAVERLEPYRDGANCFGGSHAQRDLITLTLITAAKRVGRSGLARHYANERLVHKPASGLGWRLLA